MLVVDATQGIEAQTLANLYLALDHDLDIVPVINKIDLPSAMPDEVAEEIEELFGVPAEEVLQVSAKEGTGHRGGAGGDRRSRSARPQGDRTSPLRALIFDSHYDSYKGVVAYVRVVDGVLDARGAAAADVHRARGGAAGGGRLCARHAPRGELSAGEVGYVATGLKNVRDCRVGDTHHRRAARPRDEPLPGYQPAQADGLCRALSGGQRGL